MESAGTPCPAPNPRAQRVGARCTPRAALARIFFVSVFPVYRAMLGLAILVATSCTQAAVSEALSYTPYGVADDPRAAVSTVLERATPNRQGGRVFLGYTHWEISWHLRWAEAAGGYCRLIQSQTTLRITISLPRLYGATNQRSREFLKILTGLRIHELGHASIAEDAARAIDAALDTVPQTPGCGALEAAANLKAQRLLDEYGAKQVRYDAVTDHGRRQSAWSGE